MSSVRMCKHHNIPKVKRDDGTYFCRPCNTVAMKKYRSSDHYTPPKKKPLYAIWSGMIDRTNNPHNSRFKDYSGRGITVCDRWRKFENFFEDMSPRPSLNHSLERKDVNGNYEKSNCHWATPEEQSRNKRNNRIVEYQGKKMILADAAALMGVSYQKAWRMYKLNDDVSEDDLISCEGKDITLKELSEKTGIEITILLLRAKRSRKVEYITARYRETPTYLYRGCYYTTVELSKLCDKPPNWIGNKIEHVGMSAEEAMFLPVPRLKNGEVWTPGGASFERLMEQIN